MNRFGIVPLLLATALSAPAFAEKTDYTCTVQVAKGSCWGKHTITFELIVEGAQNQTIVLKPDEFDKKIEFKCDKRRTMSFTGAFYPYIWAGKENNRSYPSRERWLTPLSIPDDSRSWLVQVCFEKDFFNAPRPISDDTTCDCTFPKDKGE